MTKPPSPVDWSAWQPVTHATLMFVLKQGKILLIQKKRGHGAGKVNGPGGKIEAGETPLQAAVRETQEELLITPLAPVKLGELHFAMSDVPHIICHVFRANDFSGEPAETEEAVPLWTPVTEIPYEKMWEDDKLWLPFVLNNQTFLGKFVFKEEQLIWNEVTV